jgi:hypothetical protein
MAGKQQESLSQNIGLAPQLYVEVVGIPSNVDTKEKFKLDSCFQVRRFVR